MAFHQESENRCQKIHDDENDIVDAHGYEVVVAEFCAVLCEMLSLCYWADKTAEVDVFNMDQRVRADIRSEAPLVRMIGTKHFAMIELETLKPFPIAGGTERVLLHNYKVVRRDDERVFLSPR